MTISNSITAGLTSFWLGTRTLNLAELERYYYGTQTTADNGMLTTWQKSQADVTRFFKPVNYIAAVVDEPVGYLAHGRFRITAGDERLEAWAEDYVSRRVSPRLDDAIRWQSLYGEAYLYLWTDKEGASKGLKLDVIPPIEGGSARALADYGGQDPEELTAAVLFKRVPVDSRRGFEEYKITVTASRIVVEKRRLEATERGGASPTATQWQPVSDEPNPAGVLPVVPLFNPTPSDVLNMIPIQDDLDKLHLDMRMAREYGGFPMLATDADSTTADLQVGPGRILTGGSFTRIEPASIQAFLDERQALLESAAKITKSLTLLTESGGNESGVALKFRQQAFLERLHGKAQRLGTATEHVLTVASRILSVDRELYELETARVEDAPSPEVLRDAVFTVEVEPNLPADELAQAQIAQIWDSIGFARETVFAKAGAENPTEEAEKAEDERESMSVPVRLPPGMVPTEVT